MITEDQAHSFAKEYIAKISLYGIEMAMTSYGLIDHGDAYMFFYNTKECVETSDLLKGVVGQGPIIIGKQMGEIIEYGSALDVDAALMDYRGSKKQGILYKRK